MSPWAWRTARRIGSSTWRRWGCWDGRRALSFAAVGLPEPADPFRVELTAPGGRTWAWGPETAAQRVQGGAAEFCLCVTRRRPWSETDLTATGEDAQKWRELARVFL
ncbi:hypothetical protein ACWD1W_26295 [Streptomyces olivaceoviridis]